MKYVCQICGYVYDEEAEGVKWDDLPEDWVCPRCTAPKSAFLADAPPEPAPVRERAEVHTDISAGELSAICSNLARGCEKQYDEESGRLFTELSEKFEAAVPPAESPSVAQLAAAIKRNADEDFAAAKAAAAEANDRGALRALVWGEKVTNMLRALLDRYEKEGSAFLDSTEVWVCTICGFIYVGDTPPEICPVCKVPSWKFEKVGGKKS